MDQRYFSIKDTATYFGLSEKLIYELAYKKAIPAFKMGKVWRVDRQEVDLWVKTRYNSAQSSRSAVELGRGGH